MRQRTHRRIDRYRTQTLPGWILRMRTVISGKRVFELIPLPLLAPEIMSSGPKTGNTKGNRSIPYTNLVWSDSKNGSRYKMTQLLWTGLLTPTSTRNLFFWANSQRIKGRIHRCHTQTLPGRILRMRTVTSIKKRVFEPIPLPLQDPEIFSYQPWDRGRTDESIDTVHKPCLVGF